MDVVSTLRRTNNSPTNDNFPRVLFISGNLVTTPSFTEGRTSNDEDNDTTERLFPVPLAVSVTKQPTSTSRSEQIQTTQIVPRWDLATATDASLVTQTGEVGGVKFSFDGVLHNVF